MVLVDQIYKALEFARDFPAWFLTALTVAMATLLYVPAINSQVPSAYHSPLFMSFVVAGIFAAFKWLEVFWRARRSAKLRKSFHVSRPETARWSVSQQQNGTSVVSINVDVIIKNIGADAIRILRPRLIKPKLRGEVMCEGAFVHTLYRQGGPLLSREAGRVHITISVRGEVGKAEADDLPVKIALVDEEGQEQRFSAICRGNRAPEVPLAPHEPG